MFLNTYTNALASARITVNGLNKTETTSNVASKDVTNNLPTKLVLGYGVDDNGYFTEDFNKAAGIPEHIKIHSSTMESMQRALVENPSNVWTKIFNNIDIAKTIGNAYQVLSQLVDEQLLNKTSFSKEELVNLPQGYEFDRSTLEVSRVHQGIMDYINADMGFNYQNKSNQLINSTFYNPVDWSDRHNPKFSAATDIFNNANGGKEHQVGWVWDTTADKYTNSDGTISMGGILTAMVNSNLNLVEGKATYWGQMQGYDKNVDPNSIRADRKSIKFDVFDYTDQELNAMSEEKREYIKGMQEMQMKLWVVNGYEVPDNARKTYNAYANSEDSWKYVNPFEKMLEELDKANKELLERLRKKAIESRQKAQEEAQKQTQGKDVDKLYEESNKAIEEFAKLIEKFQEESNQAKDPKDQWHVSADSIKKAFINAMNNQNQQSYAPTTKQQVSAFEVEA